MNESIEKIVAANERNPWRAALEIALVFVVFFLHGAWPTPDVNENGYLAKAAHFWDHHAFENDFFCNTADAHTVYYWTFGWLTTLGWSLDTVAWIGRVITWLLLAIAWRGLSYSIMPRPWVSVLSAAIFVLLTEQASMAGEWIVGGVEAKGFAWALVLWSLQALVRGRWKLAWVLIGAATSFHVVVGGWAGICLAGAWLASRSERPKIVSMLPAMVVGLVLALPGLWYVATLNHNSTSDEEAEANRIQVFERLPHHLWPSGFQPGFVSRELLVWALFGILCGTTPTLPGGRRLRWFVVVAIVQAVIGLVLGWLASMAPGFAASWLRFYWFRMADILVPLGVSLVWLEHLLYYPARAKIARWIFLALFVVLAYDTWSQLRHFPWLPEQWGRVESRSDKFTATDDWRDVCRWARENSPADAVFLTPLRSNTFKWYAGRGEAATWKDMPQDAHSVVEWSKRINEFFDNGKKDPDDHWRATLAELGDERLKELAAKYKFQYAIVERIPGGPKLSMEPVYQNGSYAVYRFDETNK
jgi:hypothetical protein